MVRVELFGNLRIIDDHRTVSRFRTQKTAALLAFLAYHLERAHPREALIDRHWPMATAGSGRHRLSQALSSLRHQLEPPGVSAGAVLMADRTSVRLNPETVTTDVMEFEAALRGAGRATDPKEQRLEEACRLYRGELLTGLYEPWIPSEQVRLSELYVGAVVELARLLAKRGEAMEAMSYLHRAIETEPLREEPYRQLMRLNAELGEPQAAVATYRELERVLAEELGEKPSAATREVVKEIGRLATQAAGPGLRSAVVPPRPARRRRPVELPTGIVTFLLIRADQGEGKGEAGSADPLREEFKRHGGVEIETERAAYTVAFGRAGDALSCAVECQLRAAGGPGASPGPLAMAVDTAEVAALPGESGPVLFRAVRLLDAAHPAQILCSEATAGLLHYDLDGGLRLRDLGVYRLRGGSARERVFQLDYPGGPDSSTPLDAQPGHSGHLPYQITRFFGRQQEIEQLEAVFTDDARLVTLIGPPGCGKTRLAIEVARRLVEPFKGNVWFVPLADLREGSDILDRALDPLGIRRQPQAKPLDQIAAALAGQPSLIVFDNFEHLIESTVEMRALLERLPGLRCLVTSRRRMGLTGEREVPVGPLPVPGEVSLQELLSNDSARLFVDRAQAVKPDFQLNAGNGATVAELCRQLEGVPLAIELAAARSHTHGLRRILEQLEEGGDLLTRSRDAEDRHRSLRAAVEWSYSLLPPELQRFFARLAAFRGGWTVEAAEAVCEEPLASDYLMQLVELSLVQTNPEQEPRYRMLEMVRQLALEHLEAAGEVESTNHRHLDYHHSLLDSLDGKWDGPDLKSALDCVEAELDNFLAAMDRCDTAPKGVTTGLHLAGGLLSLWIMRGHLRLGRAVVDRALRRDTSKAPARQRADVLNNAAILAFIDRDFTASLAMHEEALACRKAMSDKQGVAAALHGIAQAKIELGLPVEAKRLLNEALALNEELGNHNWMAANLTGISTAEYCIGNMTQARDLRQRSAEIYLEHGDLSGYYNALAQLGEISYACGEFSEAQVVLQRAVTGLRELGDFPAVARAQLVLAGVHASLDEVESARTSFREGLLFVQKHEIRGSFGVALETGALLLMAHARRLAGAEAGEALAEAQRQAARLLASAQMMDATRKDDSLAELARPLRDAMGASAFEAAWAEGLAMTFDQAIAYALDYLENAKVSAGEQQSKDRSQDMVDDCD